MLRLLIDQDFNHHVVRGLTGRIPGLDAVTASQAGLSSASDADLLAWADSEGRVLVTHDKKTMPDHAAERLARGGTHRRSTDNSSATPYQRSYR